MWSSEWWRLVARLHVARWRWWWKAGRYRWAQVRLAFWERALRRWDGP